MIRVLVVDDHTVVRSGLEQLLGAQDDIAVVGTAADGADAVARDAELAPDVVLMDLSMPGMDGITATRRILAAAPERHVVVLTSLTDRAQILDAVDAGAVGYLLKDAEPEELVAGIRAAAAGETPMAPKAVRALITARRQASPAAQLTGREREVLAAVGRGLPNKLIARELGISEKTVKAHLTRVFGAIGVTDRTQAALWVERHGPL